MIKSIVFSKLLKQIRTNISSSTPKFVKTQMKNYTNIITAEFVATTDENTLIDNQFLGNSEAKTV